MFFIYLFRIGIKPLFFVVGMLLLTQLSSCGKPFPDGTAESSVKSGAGSLGSPPPSHTSSRYLTGALALLNHGGTINWMEQDWRLLWSESWDISEAKSSGFKPAKILIEEPTVIVTDHINLDPETPIETSAPLIILNRFDIKCEECKSSHKKVKIFTSNPLTAPIKIVAEDMTTEVSFEPYGDEKNLKIGNSTQKQNDLSKLNEAILDQRRKSIQISSYSLPSSSEEKASTYVFINDYISLPKIENLSLSHEKREAKLWNSWPSLTLRFQSGGGRRGLVDRFYEANPTSYKLSQAVSSIQSSFQKYKKDLQESIQYLLPKQSLNAKVILVKTNGATPDLFDSDRLFWVRTMYQDSPESFANPDQAPDIRSFMGKKAEKSQIPILLMQHWGNILHAVIHQKKIPDHPNDILDGETPRKEIEGPSFMSGAALSENNQLDLDAYESQLKRLNIDIPPLVEESDQDDFVTLYSTHLKEVRMGFEKIPPALLTDAERERLVKMFFLSYLEKLNKEIGTEDDKNTFLGHLNEVTHWREISWGDPKDKKTRLISLDALVEEVDDLENLIGRITITNALNAVIQTIIEAPIGAALKLAKAGKRAYDGVKAIERAKKIDNAWTALNLITDGAQVIRNVTTKPNLNLPKIDFKHLPRFVPFQLKDKISNFLDGRTPDYHEVYSLMSNAPKKNSSVFKEIENSYALSEKDVADHYEMHYAKTTFDAPFFVDKFQKTSYWLGSWILNIDTRTPNEIKAETIKALSRLKAVEGIMLSFKSYLPKAQRTKAELEAAIETLKEELKE